MLLVVCQLSCEVIRYEDSLSLVRFDPPIVSEKQSFSVSQISSCPVVLSWLVLLGSFNKSFIQWRFISSLAALSPFLSVFVTKVKPDLKLTEVLTLWLHRIYERVFEWVSVKRFLKYKKDRYRVKLEVTKGQMLSETRFRYIEVLSHILYQYYYWAKENRSFYRTRTGVSLQ